MKRMPTFPHAAPLAGLALRCQPDSRLVALAREGHERAFEEIVCRYRQPLVAFAAAIVPAHRAEDVVQDALASAHGSLVSSEREISLKPWLYTIVRNRALNDLRDEPAHEPLREDFDGVPQPPEVVAQRAELAEVVTRLKGLPPAQRDALLRRELEGRSHDEIAAAIGVTPGAARALIFRARAALRDVAGLLIPLPVLRGLLNAGPISSEAAGAGVGGAAAGLTAGGGGGVAIKAGAALLAAGLAVGSGIALHERDHPRDATAATVARQPGSSPKAAASPSRLPSATPGGRSDGGSGRGPGESGDSQGGHGNHPGGPASGPGPSRSGEGSARGRDGGGSTDGSGDRRPGGQTSDGRGSDEPPGGGEAGGQHEGSGGTGGEHGGSGGTGGDHDGAGGTSGEGGGGTSGSGDDGSSSGDGGGDLGGEPTSGSHEGSDQGALGETPTDG